MDVRKELQIIKETSGSSSSLVNDLQAQMEECRKKIHIVKVFDVAMSLQKLFNEGLFEKNHISGINVYKQRDDDDEYDLGYELYDIDGEFVDHLGDDSYAEITTTLDNVFNNFNSTKFDVSMVNYDYKNKGEFIPLKVGFEREVLDVLLSKELKVVVEHSEMQNQLDSKVSNKRKNKI